MEKHSHLCCFSLNLLLCRRIKSFLYILLFIFMLHYAACISMADNSFTFSSFSYPKTKLKPYDWRYIRIDLPPSFSSVLIALESDVDLDPGQVGTMKKIKSSLPLICFRDGSLPLPDFSNNALNHLALGSLSNGSFGAIEGVESAEHCYPLEKMMTLRLTNEQITAGVWYIGLFNGIGALRTQSKMISRGSAYSFTANVSVEVCISSNFWGRFCNQTIDSLSCSLSDTAQPFTVDLAADLNKNSAKNVVSCTNSYGDSCHGDNETRVFSLEITGMAEQLTISATDITINGTLPVNTTDGVGQVVLMCYARFGAIALATLHDHSYDLSKGPLVVPLPKTGRWYITVAPVNMTKVSGNFPSGIMRVCYSLAWKVAECHLGKAGFNSTWNIYSLQTVLRKNPSIPFESYYIPLEGNLSSDSPSFPIESLLSNSSLGSNLGVAWTYFILEIPHGGAGGNIHFKLKSDRIGSYEIYARYSGLPSSNLWDYYYVNQTKNSDGAMFFSLYTSSKEMVDFYILYAREGLWSFGLKHYGSNDMDASLKQTELSLSVERCPKKCSAPHGSCQNFVDESGLTVYSYCSCDRTHGGIDCSIEIVSHQGHLWQSVSLIASNAAAILPAYWALRKKAYAEWVIYSASGISSGLYHACDVGTWCALTFRALQFMDFWLSFMAVVSTFVYLPAIDEASKRTIHAIVAILTALLAISGATRSANIGLVITIGAMGLLVGWFIELATKQRSLSSIAFCSNTIYSWPTIRGSLSNVVKKLLKRFYWGFILAGATALAIAAASWKLETSQSYWIWHSIWHVSIYTSSFFFLCSKIAPTSATAEDQTLQNGYELTRQNSVPRVQE